jgi:hypothetical protein
MKIMCQSVVIKQTLPGLNKTGENNECGQPERLPIMD